MELVGYQMSRKEMRDIYHSVYLLRRCPGSPSCGEQERRRAIHDILTSLTVQLQRQMHPTSTEDISPHAGGWVGLGQQESYEAALWVACHRALETTETLWSNLKRLGSERRRRSWAHSQSQSRDWSRACSGNWSRTHSRTQSRTHSRGQSGDHARAHSQSCYHGDLLGVWPRFPDGPLPKRRVSFHNPNDVKDPMKEEASCLTEPSVDDLEMWLEFQVGQLGTPAWWEELGTVPGIEDRHKFVQKIRVSFYVPEVQLRASPEHGYTVLPAPQLLNKGTFHLERFAYQDVRQQPALLTIAYARCLQHWAKKHNLPRNPDFCPWAECVRELRQTVQEFVNISYQDITRGLEVEKPEISNLQLKMTIFSWVLATPVDEQKAIEAPPHPVSPLAEDGVI